VTAIVPPAITLDHFAPLQGTGFELRDAGDAAWTAQLARAQALPYPAHGGRQPFSLVFEVPGASTWAQGLFKLKPLADHPAALQLGELQVFMVPIDADAQRVRYEAIFN